jgi:hypothetical protein
LELLYEEALGSEVLANEGAPPPLLLLLSLGRLRLLLPLLALPSAPRVADAVAANALCTRGWSE